MGEAPATQRDLNLRIARRLEEVAQLLSDQEANRFRVQAYRNAAETLRRLPQSVDDILKREGKDGLRKLPGIGESLARAIATVVFTGQLPMLQRLRGESESGLLLASVPGIGRVLAARLHHDLGIETLEDLEAAAHDSRLRKIPGMGDKRVAGIIDSLASRLGRVPRPRKTGKSSEPPLAELLDVDREYREKAAAGRLHTIAPRRFNPKREAWLPILHTERGSRHYMALFSNTARAHRLGKTRDWIVLYYDGRDGEGQCTVITSQRGRLAGKRIVRGRETECLEHYRQANVQSAPPDAPTEACGQPAPVRRVAAVRG
jgi:Holliday junction resolvasome RuvABC DNA-binding subunit